MAEKKAAGSCPSGWVAVTGDAQLVAGNVWSCVVRDQSLTMGLFLLSIDCPLGARRGGGGGGTFTVL